MAPCDLVLVEGFKKTSIPKLEVRRAKRQTSVLAKEDSSIVAVASDYEISGLDIPVFNLSDIPSDADFIWKYVHDRNSTATASRNDCFALPPDVDWTPVDEAKRLLKDADIDAGVNFSISSRLLVERIKHFGIP